MGLDVRVPIGAMFTLLGLLLTVYGLLTNGNAAAYERSLSINVNLWWGIALLIFGCVMLLFGLLRRSSLQGMQTGTAEERAMENREHELGLEE